MKRAIAAVAVLAVALPARAAGPSPTVDDVLSLPFVDGLAASPRRDALVWTVHERGARNVAVWLDGLAREVTHATADDGEEIAGAQFTPDDSAVVYERGGAGQDGGGENPNPTSPAKRVDRQILLTSLATGATIHIGDGREPAVSPQGDRIAWIDGSHLAVATLATKDAGKTWTAGTPETPCTVRGSVHGPLWSPDGTRIAFTNDRTDHTFVAIYTFGNPSVVFAAPGFANDGAPAWSKDGTKIAFVRTPGTPTTATPYDDPATAPPWSVVVADGHSGNGGVVWRAPRGRGSEFQVADDVQPLFWSQRGDLAFVWERDGWRHLYALRDAAGTPRLLTPGAFDVEQIAGGASGDDLVYTSNEGDLDSRHVWRVPFRDGVRGRVSGAPANQWSPADLAGGLTAFVDAAYAKPGTVTVARSGAAPAPVVPPPASDALAAFVKPRAIRFHAPDGLAIHGQLFEPRGGGKHPAMIFVHGGPERQMLTTFHYFETYTNFFEIDQLLANRGIEVLSVNYRSGIMYGHDFFEAPNRGFLGASEYQDVLAGARYLGARPDVDRSRLGIYGLSYGGYLTALALARNSDVFSVGADQAGVHDWRAILDAWSGRPVGTPEQRRIAYEASPMASIRTWRSPVYLSQGDVDRNVPFDQGIELATALEARGVVTQFSVVPDELHEYTTYAHNLARFTETVDFITRHLYGR